MTNASQLRSEQTSEAHGAADEPVSLAKELAAQAPEALRELISGLCATDSPQDSGLDAAFRADPERTLRDLRAVLLRIVFLWLAEDRALLPLPLEQPRALSLVGLVEDLRRQRARSAQEMVRRFSAWPRLLELFCRVRESTAGTDPRSLFSDASFVERAALRRAESRSPNAHEYIGSVRSTLSDAAVLRVLEKLVPVEEDRSSFRNLGVEHLGSVYEHLMGFRLERAAELSLPIGKGLVVVGLESLLQTKGPARARHLQKITGAKLSAPIQAALPRMQTVEELVTLLARRAPASARAVIATGQIFLQPTDRRRRAGAHYTPRDITTPVVHATLRPLLDALGSHPPPEAILALKICDPAMGTGAFLIEVCHQLGHELVRAWETHGRPPSCSNDDDLPFAAQRLVAQCCVYGVDRDPDAVEIGKLSLWLATAAHQHPFTFLDHCLRHGDSLVGLTVEQMASVQGSGSTEIASVRAGIERDIAAATTLRGQLSRLTSPEDEPAKQHLLQQAHRELTVARAISDSVVATFLAHERRRERNAACRRLRSRIERSFDSCSEPRKGPPNEPRSAASAVFVLEKSAPLPPLTFHWPIEFPEVFAREDPGFDAVVGNPPFLNAIEARTGRATALSELYAQLFPIFAQGAYDTCVLFWARVTTLLLRRSGRYGMISPLALLSGERRWRTWMHEHWRPDGLRAYPVDEFEAAAIRVVGVMGRAGASPICAVTVKNDDGTTRHHVFCWPTPPQGWYGALAAPDSSWASEPEPDCSQRMVLAQRFFVRAGCATSVAYELSPWVSDSSSPLAPEALRLITTGAIDRYRHKWGHDPTRYLRRDFLHPRWPAGGCDSLPTGVVRARDAQRRPKLLVGGLTAVLEAWLDESADSAGVVSTWVITPRETASNVGDPRLDVTRLKALTLLLNSCTCTREFMAQHGASAMSGNQTTIKKAALMSTSIPDVFHTKTGFDRAEFCRALGEVCPRMFKMETAFTDEEQLAVLHDLIASSPTDENADAFGHFVSARLFGRSERAAVEDYRWWQTRARRIGRISPVPIAAAVYALPRRKQQRE